MNINHNSLSMALTHDMQNGRLSLAESIICNSKKLQDDLELLGLKIKEHEDNIRNMKTQKNTLNDMILEMQVSLGKYHLNASTTTNEELIHFNGEEETIKQIVRHERSAAALLCQLKTHVPQASHLTWTSNLLGIVATLGKVNDENLSKLLSEYLGMETMLAIVCKTYEGIQALETYDMDGSVNRESGIHGHGVSISWPLGGRFRVICLEALRPYYGAFVANDPQKRLDILKPKLPNGECPPGFLGFAVNMINVDTTNLYSLTESGYGLRETLFYHLFSRLQVYKTRADMLHAVPFITDGAISLDGGMIKNSGDMVLGDREDVDIRFPKCSGTSGLPLSCVETENKIKELKWRKERMLNDVQKEEALLEHAKFSFAVKKQEFVKFIAESSYITQHQLQAGQGGSTPR